MKKSHDLWVSFWHKNATVTAESAPLNNGMPCQVGPGYSRVNIKIETRPSVSEVLKNADPAKGPVVRLQFFRAATNSPAQGGLLNAEPESGPYFVGELVDINEQDDLVRTGYARCAALMKNEHTGFLGLREGDALIDPQGTILWPSAAPLPPAS